jgi:ribosomal protein S1
MGISAVPGSGKTWTLSLLAADLIARGNLKEGQEVEVKIIDIDPKTGKIKLSRKELLPRPPRPEHDKKPDPNDNNK